MNKKELTLKFITTPNSMNVGAGKLANRYNVSKDDIYKAKEHARQILHNDEIVTCQNAVHDLEEKLVEVSNELGTLHLKLTSEKDIYKALSDVELAKLHNVDLTKYKITNYWTKQQPNGKFTASLFCKLINTNSQEYILSEFKLFLENYKPKYIPVSKNSNSLNKENCCLIIPKQDSHFNKYDIYGDNDIYNRFSKVHKSILINLQKASLSNNIEEVLYIVGSDQFNSEWTNLTTKGTPQQNILTYQESFTKICDHEIQSLTTLLQYSEKVRVIFVPGNHDEFVGWHLINYLETYFRNELNIVFDTSTLNTKYYKFHNTAIMLNHGDAIKPKELAHKFPIGFKQEWSDCDYFYIFTGDKHHELSLDIHGIKFYQVPQLSNAKSKWDDKQGYTDVKAEMQIFNISNSDGMTDIYKTIIK